MRGMNFFKRKVACDIVFYKDPVDISFQQYANGRAAISLSALNEYRDREPIATATVNLPDEPCPQDEVFVKDWGENEGMAGFLFRAGVISSPVQAIAHSGFVEVRRFKLTPEAAEYFKEKFLGKETA